ETMSLDENLFSILRGKWRETGKTFLETGAGRQIAYGELDGETARLANAIVACGVKPGDRVAVQTEKSPEALLLYLACLRAGAAYLPLNTAYTPAEVEYFVGDAEPALVVCRPGTRETVAAICAKVGVAACHTLAAGGSGSLTELASRQPTQVETIARRKDDLAAILYTSGTTGRSKGAMMTHENLASNARALAECWRFSGED